VVTRTLSLSLLFTPKIPDSPNNFDSAVWLVNFGLSTIMKNHSLSSNIERKVLYLFYGVLVFSIITMVFTNRGSVVPSIVSSSLLVYIIFPHNYLVISITLLFVLFITWLLYNWTNGAFDVYFKKFIRARFLLGGLLLLVALMHTAIELGLKAMQQGSLQSWSVICLLCLICIAGLTFLVEQTITLLEYQQDRERAINRLNNIPAQEGVITSGRIITQGMPVDKEWRLLNSPIILRGDNKKEVLVVEPVNLLYLHSADNYIRIFFRKNSEIHSILFRGTLKKLEETLSAYDFIMRCHKTYLVNLYHVHQIKGNASGLKLYITGIPEPIPVSRSLNKEILKRLSHLRHRGRF